MYKKTLLSLAVASTLTLTGCLDEGSNNKNGDPDYKITDTNFDSSLTRPLFNPNILTDSDTVMPTNYDLLLLLGTTAADYDFTGLTSGTDPASNALNDLDGHSTSGQFDIEFNNSLNPATVLKNQTVFVVPLVTEPISPSFDQAIPKAVDPSNIDLDGSSGVTGAPFDLAVFADPTKLNVRVEVIDINGGTDNAIRVTPLLPLPAETKFLVFMTDGILGTDGRAIGESKDYTYFKEGNAPSALAAVTGVVQGHDGLANAFVAASEQILGAAIPNNVVMSHFFTTTNPTAVMDAMASPVTAFTKTGQQVVLLSGLQVVKDESTNPNATAGDHFANLGAAVADITANPGAPQTELGQKVAAAIGPYLLDPTLAAQVVGGAFAGGGFKSMPIPRASHFYQTNNAATLTAFAGLDDANLLKQAATTVKVSEGAITLPYYSPLPEGADGTNLITGMWRGDTNLETTLNGVITTLQGTYPDLPNFSFLRDADNTFNVTYSQPFALEIATVTVPVTITHPITTAGYPCNASGITNVAIFQHGITADRSVSLIPAVNLAASGCIATIAMDQPLHGLGGSTVGLVPGLDVLTQEDIAGSPVDGADYIGERHFMFNDTSGTLTPELQTDITNVSSGSLAINLKSLQTTRDSLRQAAMDLLNLNSSIVTFNIDGVPNALAGLPVHFIGHSLGGIAGTPYAAINNNATVRGAYAALAPDITEPFFKTLESVSLMNTGGQLTKLAESSSVFSGAVLGGLAANSVNQGSSTFESFMLLWQGTVDSIDPVNYGIDLGSTTPKILMSEVLNDLRVPNEANVNPLENALSAPLAGTEPLMALVDIGLGGTNLSDGTGLGIIDSDTAPSAGLTGAQASFFANSNPCTDANHITFITPQTPPSATDTICPNGSDTSAAFAEMITEVTTLIAAGVVPVTANGPALLGKSTTIESALDQNAP